MTLEEFISSIEKFDAVSTSGKIDYFIYFHTIIKGEEGIKSSDVGEYFDKLKLKRYSNIPQYLSQNTVRKKGTNPKFLVQKGLYHLERNRKNQLDLQINLVRQLVPSHNLFPLELVDDTRGYISKIASQAIICYDYQLYDASLVMIRKLLETLLIEIYEKYSLSTDIKDSDGNFFMLGPLIDAFLSNTNWNVGRTTKQYLPHIKKLANISAHNRRFNAKKPDIDKYKDELRIIIEELVHIAEF